MAVAERYQVYLNNPFVERADQLYYRSTQPAFGEFCQYICLIIICLFLNPDCLDGADEINTADESYWVYQCYRDSAFRCERLQILVFLNRFTIFESNDTYYNQCDPLHRERLFDDCERNDVKFDCWFSSLCVRFDFLVVLHVYILDCCDGSTNIPTSPIKGDTQMCFGATSFELSQGVSIAPFSL